LKKFRLVKSYEKRILLNLFRDLDKVLNLEKSTFYRDVSLSCFDHWLSEEESLKLLTNASKIDHRKRINQQYNFIKMLINRFDVYKYHYSKTRKNFCFIKFYSNDDLLRNLFIYENELFYLVIPQIKTILISGFDYTNHFYYQDKKLFFDKMTLLVKMNKLHLI